MLVRGDAAPEFEAPTGGGSKLRLSTLRGRTVVLYFFPKAGSLGCTHESKRFAARYPEFQANGTEIVGVSVDSVEEQGKFASDCALPFPLVADIDQRIARA